MRSVSVGTDQLTDEGSPQQENAQTNCGLRLLGANENAMKGSPRTASSAKAIAAMNDGVSIGDRRTQSRVRLPRPLIARLGRPH